MIRRIVSIAGSLGLGGLGLAGLYWLFLITPESNVLALAASAVLVLAMVAVAGLTVNTALLLAQGGASGQLMRSALRGVRWFAIAAIPVVAAWIAIREADGWVERHSGEISAWFIARFGRADVSALFHVHTWMSRWLRWVVVPIASLCLLGALLRDGFGALVSTRWICRARHWRTLLPATVVFFVLLVLPWQLAGWRPTLPPTWVQAAVAGLRLGAAVVLGLIGCAVLVSLTVPAGLQSRPSGPGRE